MMFSSLTMALTAIVSAPEVTLSPDRAVTPLTVTSINGGPASILNNGSPRMWYRATGSVWPLSVAAVSVRNISCPKIHRPSVWLIMLSYGEGFGLVMKEAQACGCKTLVFKGDGMEDTAPDFAIGRDEDVAVRIKQAIDSTNGLPWSGGNPA